MTNPIDAGFRRILTPFIVRMLRQSAAQKANKKQQEEKAKTSPLNAVASKRYRNTQKLAEWKKSAKKLQFPTGGRRYRADKKRIKQEFKKTKKIQKQLYKTDGAYRATHVPRATRSEKYDMGASVLRHEAKHGSSIITRTQSARVLKNWILPIYEGLDARTWVKPLNPFGRKKRKKFKIELERAKLDLKGDV